MKNLLIVVFLALMAVGCKDKTEKTMDKIAEKNMETEDAEEETVSEWTDLFDGTSFAGWKEYGSDEVSDHWKIEDGAMVFYPPKERQEGESHNLVTEKEFTDFILSLDWKIAEAGNSGIMWGVKEDPKFDQPYKTGPEIQVLDNDKHPDGKNGTTHQAGALYDMIAPSEDVTKPVGEWNTMVITVNNSENQGSVMLNGEEIVNFPIGNELWNEMVSKSKFDGWEGFGKYTKGKLALQDHGDRVAYRNIKIKEL
ncbi:MAG: 3-keto-disaccharide hydrolase [Aurantibacter sp.]